MPQVPPWWLQTARCCSTTADGPSSSRRTSSSPAAPCSPQCRCPHAQSTQPSPGWRWRSGSVASGTPSADDLADGGPGADARTHACGQPGDRARRGARASGCSIFIASSTTTRSPSATCAPSATATLTIVPCIGDASVVPLRRRARGPLRRAGRPRAGAGRAAAAGQGERGGQDDLDALAADLDDDALEGRSARRPRPPPAGAAGASGRRAVSVNSVSIQRVCTRERLSRGRPARTPRSSSTARWNGTTVGMPTTSSSASARRARSIACVRVGAGDDELGDHRVEQPRDAVALDDSRVDPDTRAGREAQRADPAGCRQEVRGRVLAVDAELERVAARLDVVVAQRLSRGDPQLLADQVDAADLLGDRVLDLQARVDLEERDGAVERRRGTRTSRRRRTSASRRIALLDSISCARCASVRNGAGASSTSFWWRRCSEQSRVLTTTTVPCSSARHCVSTCRGLSR